MCKNRLKTVFSVRPASKPLTLALTLCSTHLLFAGALENFVQQPDSSFTWKKVDASKSDGFTITHLKLTSQTWHGQVWTHDLQIFRPRTVRNPGIAALYITGDGRGQDDFWIAKTIAERGGAVFAILTCVPNQPLCGGRREDALIAYTFDQYFHTGDESWPLLFPMVKSAVRAMDAVQAWAASELRQQIKRFVVSGASKRGWTAWLTGAMDCRVCGLVPVVIDLLNINAQIAWEQAVYGRVSEELHDYTNIGLTTHLNEPREAELLRWVDPYTYRSRYTMPKLLLLGTNDRYWTVDSLRHYWDALPGPKFIFQMPNAGHRLEGGEDAVQTVAAFFQMIADGEELPKMDWQLTDTSLTVNVNRHAKSIRLWTAASPTRDFRDAKWKSSELPIRIGSSHATAEVDPPAKGYRAFMCEAVLTTSTGQTYRLSTPAWVTPDTVETSVRPH